MNAGRAVMLGLLGWASCAFAIDAWDAGPAKDNTAVSTRNLLRPGVTQYHDLEAAGGVPDEDWFVLNLDDFRQYYIEVTEVSADTPISNVDFLTIWDDTGTTQLYQALTGPTSASTTWYSGNRTSFRVRVKGGPTTPGTSRYGITYYENTLYCARYNQSASQVSIVIVQNTTNGACPVSAWFYDEAGAFVGNIFGTAPAGGNFVAAAGSVPALAGTKGNVRIINACVPWALKAKVVSLEPATGFSFDTLCERR